MMGKSFAKTVLSFLMIVTAPSLMLSAQAKQAKQAARQEPKFPSFPAPTMKGQKAPLKLNAEDRMFRTRYRDLHKSKPNFAGHYVLTGVGCGASCFFMLGVDLKLGQTIRFDMPMGEGLISCSEEYKDDLGATVEKDFSFRSNSRLIIVNGRMDGLECGARYFQEKNGKLIHIMDIAREKSQ